MKSGFITVDGTQLNYLIEGTGIPCLVIGATKNWPRKTFSEELRKYIKFIFMDNRAFVPPDVPVDISKVTIETAVDDVELLRKKLGFEKIAVSGCSYPALLALAYAQKYPDNASHVIMVDMTPYWNDKALKIHKEYWETHASDERKEILKRNHEQLTDEILSKVSPGKAYWMRYVANAPMYWYDPTYDCSWLFESFDINPDRAGHCLDEELPHYVFTQGDEITTPVFLALGQYSFIGPYYMWDDYKDKLPNLSYNLFEKSGHYPMHEEQELLIKN
jgi:proline iminopeptidase